jgi:uncharacterized protein YabN with tetrapyrrole methylase and pyrophosphatase domain
MTLTLRATLEREWAIPSINEVVGGIVAKLVARHPYVFSDEEVPEDLDAAWEARKAAVKDVRNLLVGEHIGVTGHKLGDDSTDDLVDVETSPLFW